MERVTVGSLGASVIFCETGKVTDGRILVLVIFNTDGGVIVVEMAVSVILTTIAGIVVRIFVIVGMDSVTYLPPWQFAAGMTHSAAPCAARLLSSKFFVSG